MGQLEKWSPRPFVLHGVSLRVAENSLIDFGGGGGVAGGGRRTATAGITITLSLEKYNLKHYHLQSPDQFLMAKGNSISPP